MRSSHYYRHAEILLEKLSRGVDPAQAPFGAGNTLEELCATLLNSRGSDAGKLARLMGEARQRMRLSPELSRRLAAECLIERCGLLASAENQQFDHFATGDEDKSIPFLIKKASPLTEREQAWVWERSVGVIECPLLIKRLVKLGIDPEAMGEDRISPLSRASIRFAPNITALILAGANPNGLAVEQKSPLMRSFEHAYQAGAKALLAGGADVIESRLPFNLPAFVGVARPKSQWRIQQQNDDADCEPMIPLALALSEIVALSASANNGAPESAPVKSPRL